MAAILAVARSNIGRGHDKRKTARNAERTALLMSSRALRSTRDDTKFFDLRDEGI
jgi:hypothetical protein